jgi:hypothetical protein
MYIFNFIFTDILQHPVEITSNKEDFIKSKKPKLNYSEKAFGKELFICAHELLFEKEIKKQNIVVTEWKNVKTFFQTDNNSFLPFDIFAASFYLISRYEEVLPHRPDVHGRFHPENSLAYKKNFLRMPIIDKWAYIMANQINKQHPSIDLGKRNFKYIPTIDVDNAYAYLYKGLVRTLGASARSFFNMNINENIERTKVLSGNKKDPFDTYQYIENLHRKYDEKTIYFFLTGKYGKYDRNVSLSKDSFQQLIKERAETAEVGIHFSYSSNRKEKLMANEVKQLKNILQKPVNKSRQHFIKLDMPVTYQRLLSIGINQDYSMGYPSEIGFRAGTATPFYYYDLENEIKTNLLVYPFQIMDGTFFQYYHQSPDEAWPQIKDIILKIKEINGVFISLWHNETFADRQKYNGWGVLYEKMQELIHY